MSLVKRWNQAIVLVRKLATFALDLVRRERVRWAWEVLEKLILYDHFEPLIVIIKFNERWFTYLSYSETGGIWLWLSISSELREWQIMIDALTFTALRGQSLSLIVHSDCKLIAQWILDGILATRALAPFITTRFLLNLTELLWRLKLVSVVALAILV